MSALTIFTSDNAATIACGVALAPFVERGDVVVLSGDLGAGKTQLTKGLATGLGVVEPVTSPTFNILLVHEGRIPLYHFDLYRLERSEQLTDLDYWGTLEADGVSAVEWGDRFDESIPDQCVIVRILVIDDDARSLQIDPRGQRGQALALAWAGACEALEGVRVERGEAQ